MKQSYYALTQTTSLFDLINDWYCHPYIFNVIKYVVRSGKKDSLELVDLDKALDYLKQYRNNIFINGKFTFTQSVEHENNMFIKYILHSDIAPWAIEVLRFIIGHRTVVELDIAQRLIEAHIHVLKCTPEELIAMYKGI